MPHVRIEPIDQRSAPIAAAIHTLHSLAYRQEACILRIAPADFPPLRRTVPEIIQSREQFTAAIEADQIIGVIGIEPPEHACWSGEKLDTRHIASLAVHPHRQREGIARMLVRSVINPHDAQTISVSTAVGNKPAISLYRSLGFVEAARRSVACGLHQLELVLLKRA